MSKIKVMSVTGNPDLLHFKNLQLTERKKTYEIQEMHESEYDHQVKLLKRDASLRIQIKRLQPLCNQEPFTMDDSFMSKTVKRPLLLIQNGTPTVHASRRIKFTQTMISQAYESQLRFFNSRKNTYVQMMLSIDDQLYPIIIELFNEFAPKACENFTKFCEGVNVEGKFYSYKKSKFTKYKPNGFIQGGQFDKKVSIYGGYFEDESYALKHDCEGIIGFANDGFQHTNHSQFYITLAPMPFFDYKRVAFGKIIRGMKQILKVLKQEQHFDIVIYDCGRYDHQQQIKLKLEKFTDDFYSNLPENAQSFNKFIEAEQLKHNEASGDFTQLVKYLVEQMRIISKFVYSLTNLKKAIQQLNESFLKTQYCQILYILDNQQTLQADNQQSKYIVAFRAVDGTDSCRASAFIIFKKQTTMFKQVTLNDFKQQAEQIVSMGYCVYGQTTQLVFGTGYNLSMFTLQNNEFKLQQQELQIPKKETFYSTNIKDDFLQNKIIANLSTKVLRYTDSIFTTLHRVVRLGGLAMYKEVSIFEAIICAFTLARSWGWSFCDGTTTFNQIRIRDINQLTYLYIGQQKWIQKIENHFLSIV
ncbi:unnamed protein product [Paramecium pentaurelia]|uniref:PPIase cyclophilin-type domain-containing protein n=1 Tax=Paramecium pentaurelia TaxID=43138 RepID=A0A8S1TVK0_9CILI|nr:unnamed protein product [Paramecium pentaurelia]